MSVPKVARKQQPVRNQGRRSEKTTRDKRIENVENKNAATFSQVSTEDRSIKRKFLSETASRQSDPIDRFSKLHTKTELKNRSFHSEADKDRERPPVLQGKRKDRKQRVVEQSNSPF
jgi:hypothetical protein